MSEPIKGYKVFNPDWTCRDFQYEVGKAFEDDVTPKCCSRGFHFCTKASDCFSYYGFNPENKVAEVLALGTVDTESDDTKCCTNKIQIVREISWQELLTIVNTGKGHADLSADYSSVPNEMKKVAQYFGKEVCAEISEEEVIANLAKVRAFAGDRSVMRAFHFFEENKRVEQEVKALRENDFAAFLEGITASGNSSWKWLQNVYTTADVQEQGISIALALTELFIAKKGRGACRVHGGGFAGVIMAMIPNDLVDEYTEYIENAIGEGNVYRMSIRPHGAICVSERI